MRDHEDGDEGERKPSERGSVTGTRRAREERVDRFLIAGGVGWGLILFVLAVVVPVESVNTGRAGEQPMRTLVQVHGYEVLALVAIPGLLAVAAGVLLQISMSTGARRPAVLGSVLSATILLGALILTVTILVGIYVLPMAIALVAASQRVLSRTERPPP